jgi:hypothetical protein
MPFAMLSNVLLQMRNHAGVGSFLSVDAKLNLTYNITLTRLYFLSVDSEEICILVLPPPDSFLLLKCMRFFNDELKYSLQL